MTPAALKEYLAKLAQNRLRLSTMIWGGPGVGKSSIVAQVAAESKMGFIDVRLSQLAPTDLRGPSTPTNHTVPKVPTGAKVPLPANRFFLSSACCVLVASAFAGG